MANAVARLFYGNVEERMSQGFELVSEEQRQMSDLILGMKGYLTEVHGYVQRLESQVQALQSTVVDIAEQTADTLTLVTENKAKQFIGKETEILDIATEKAKRATFKEVRDLVNMAADRQPDGYNAIYAKVKLMTGYSVYDDGKKRIKKSDKLGYTNNSATYVNTLFLSGYKDELHVISTEMIKNK